MKEKAQERPFEGLPFDSVGSHIIIAVERGRLTAVLDHALEPLGARYPIKTFASVKDANQFAGSQGLDLFTVIPNPHDMPKGQIYYAKIAIKYRSGTSKAMKESTIKTSCVGYDPDDALDRMKKNPEKVMTRIKSSLNLKKTQKIRDVEIVSLDVIHESGQTMYDIDTGKPIK